MDNKLFGIANVTGSPASSLVASAVIAGLANQLQTSGTPSTLSGWIALILPVLLAVAGILAKEGARPDAPEANK